jgi:hypothetical protein
MLAPNEGAPAHGWAGARLKSDFGDVLGASVSATDSAVNMVNVTGGQGAMGGVP